jgi:ABC-type branched-subunit amino acid transport system permease subunit
VLAQSLLFSSGITFGRDALVFLGRPSMFAGDTAFYYFALAVVVAGVVVIEVIRVSRLGRFLRSLADSPTAVQSLGVNPTVSRVLVFCLSAFFAAIAGGLLGSLVRSINQTSFDAFLSLVWLTVLVAAGTTTFSGSVLAAVLFIAVPATFTSTTVVEWQPVAFGVAAMLLSQAPNGLAGVLFRRPDLAAFARRSAWRSDRRRADERELIANLGRAG